MKSGHLDTMYSPLRSLHRHPRVLRQNSLEARQEPTQCYCWPRYLRALLKVRTLVVLARVYPRTTVPSLHIDACMRLSSYSEGQRKSKAAQTLARGEARAEPHEAYTKPPQRSKRSQAKMHVDIRLGNCKPIPSTSCITTQATHRVVITVINISQQKAV
jgi:hypothetical protein